MLSLMQVPLYLNLSLTVREILGGTQYTLKSSDLMTLSWSVSTVTTVRVDEQGAKCGIKTRVGGELPGNLGRTWGKEIQSYKVVGRVR